jgi:hypothetical protein
MILNQAMLLLTFFFVMGLFAGFSFFYKSKKNKVVSSNIKEDLVCEYTGPFNMISRQLSNDIAEYLERFERDEKFEIKTTFIINTYASKAALSSDGWKINGVPYIDREGEIAESLSFKGLKKYNIDSTIWSFIRPDLKKSLEKNSNFTFTIKFSMKPMVKNVESKKVDSRDAALIAAELEANSVLRQELSDFGIKVIMKSEEEKQ